MSSAAVGFCSAVLGGAARRLRPLRPSYRPLCSSIVRCEALPSPDVPRLADTARISLSPQEVEEFGPKINQVIGWFGQLQAIDLESVEPTFRADTEFDATPREDLPEIFENREGIIAAIPSYSEPYIKVPKVLNKE